MEKTIKIDNKTVKFASNGYTPIEYSKQFGRQFFADIMKISTIGEVMGGKSKKIDVNKIDSIDFNCLYDICWILYKSANDDALPLEQWLRSFDSFPVIEIIGELMDLLMASMQSLKK